MEVIIKLVVTWEGLMFTLLNLFIYDKAHLNTLKWNLYNNLMHCGKQWLKIPKQEMDTQHQ